MTRPLFLRHNPHTYPDFEVRNIAVNGIVWTGFGESDVDTLFRQNVYPGENPLSACIRIRYGRFDYFTGGDIPGIDATGAPDFRSVESVIAPVVGPVDVATLNHHGNRDSQNAYYVRSLRPQVWIGQVWSSDHPGHDVLRRITSRDMYPGPRDVFTTDMLEANENVIGELVNHACGNKHGHVVVRVYDHRNTFDVYVLDDLSPVREVVKKVGPYRSR